MGNQWGKYWHRSNLGNASVQYIDFECLTDGESMRKILAQIKPRQLVGSHMHEQCICTAGEI